MRSDHRAAAGWHRISRVEDEVVRRLVDGRRIERERTGAADSIRGSGAVQIVRGEASALQWPFVFVAPLISAHHEYSHRRKSRRADASKDLIEPWDRRRQARHSIILRSCTIGKSNTAGMRPWPDYQVRLRRHLRRGV